MSPRTVPHFEEPGRVNPTLPGARLPRALYATALDHLVITCVDIVLTHHNHILLGQRRQQPRADWWVLGGRMSVGERPEVAARRKVQTEAGLVLACDRFHFVGVYSTCFAVREQAPAEHGSHTVNLTYQAELTANERDRVQLDADEYTAEWRWLTVQQAEQLLQPPNPLDLALLHILHDLRLGQPD